MKLEPFDPLSTSFSHDMSGTKEVSSFPSFSLDGVPDWTTDLPPALNFYDIAPVALDDEQSFAGSSSSAPLSPLDELNRLGESTRDLTTPVAQPAAVPVVLVDPQPSGRTLRRPSRRAAKAAVAAATDALKQCEDDDDDSSVSSVTSPVHVGVSGGIAAAARKGASAAASAAAAAAAKQFEATREAKKRTAPSLKRKSSSNGPQRTQLTKAEVELGATLDLSRDELLNMTSDALEEYARRLAEQRPLTAEEQKRFKRQRRLIKNRESAQLSRLRKKAYVDELEREIAHLKEDRDAHQRRATSAERAQQSLMAECEYLRSLLAQHPALASLAADRSAFAVPPPAEPVMTLQSDESSDSAEPPVKRRLRRNTGIAVL